MTRSARTSPLSRRPLLLGVTLLTACGRSGDHPLAPLPPMKGLQVVAADRQEGPSGARFRAEGWTELADVVSARGSLDAYVASLERDRFSPVRPDWREDYSCAPRPEQELFACHYEAHRRGPRGHERLSLVAKGVDTILKADGSRLGEGMKVEVHWDRTPL